MVSQVSIIETALLRAVKKNPEMAKTDIMTIVCDELNVPRPTVRRVKKNLLLKLHEYVDVLT